jgi:UDP-N-acetylenolpyruvoylglucosamine reductase
VAIPQSSIDALQNELSGYVLQPGEPGYNDVVTIDNGRVDQRPSIIVTVNSVQDVVLAMRFAQSNALPLTVKGGGHSATGYCLNTGGIAIDLSLLKKIEFDKRNNTVRVQMGALWNDVYLYLIANGDGLIPIGGGCPTVGIPGFMLGGGYSFVSRSYGLSIDNLLSLTIVTADGAVRRLSDASASQEDRDLWWACRGGGGGNFGIVMDMEIRVHQPPTKTMFMTQIRYNPAQAQDVLGFYNEWAETTPNELAAYGIWGYFPDPADFSAAPQNIEQFGFTIVYNGEVNQGVKLIEPLLQRNPLSALLNRLTLPEFEEINGKSTLVAHRDAYICSGMMAPRKFTSEVISIMSRYMGSAPSQSSFMVWTNAGGKISDVSSNATAFFHREARFVPELKAIWDSPEQARENVEWARAFFTDLQPHFSGAYVNYIDPLLPQWSKQYYGANYARLLEIKKRCDPNDFFCFQQSIGSPFEPQTSQPLDLSPLNRTVVIP